MSTSVEVLERNRLFADMVNGKPYKSYKKTILGKVYVSVWDSFNEAPDGVLLIGDPKKNEEGCIIDLWSEKEDMFFRRMNKSHLDNGTLLSYERPVDTEHVKTFEESTDEELVQFINSKYFTIQNKLNSISTLPVLFRLLSIAKEKEKSEKIIKLIEARISEIQTMEVMPSPTEDSEPLE